MARRLSGFLIHLFQPSTIAVICKKDISILDHHSIIIGLKISFPFTSIRTLTLPHAYLSGQVPPGAFNPFFKHNG
jgi:hypothetical protein